MDSLERAEQRAQMARRVEELEKVLRQIVEDAMENPTSIPAKVTWTSIHKAQALLEE
jgi:hypothetical protein